MQNEFHIRQLGKPSSAVLLRLRNRQFTLHTCLFIFCSLVLDKLYLTGLEDIFLSITLKAIQKFSIGVESIHLDSSFLSVEGEYENTLIEEAKVEVISFRSTNATHRSTKAPVSKRRGVGGITCNLTV